MEDFKQLICNVTQLSQTECEHAILADIKYATIDNIVGRVIDGYEPHNVVRRNAVLGKDASIALCNVQNQLNQHGMGLIIKDAYRPRRAVLDFLTWSKAQVSDERELAMKAKHYPDLTKPQLFEQGYFAEDSSHCYGNTTDVMLIDLKDKLLIDMGAPFDFMGKKSNLSATAEDIGRAAYEHRQLLQQLMTDAGFEPYETEFWHFSYDGHKGRLSDTPFDVPLTALLFESSHL